MRNISGPTASNLRLTCVPASAACLPGDIHLPTPGGPRSANRLPFISSESLIC